jgi:hypothetical protein
LVLSKIEGFNSLTDGLVYSLVKNTGPSKNIQVIIVYLEKTKTSFLPWKDVPFMSKEQLDEISRFEENAKQAVKLL